MLACPKMHCACEACGRETVIQVAHPSLGLDDVTNTPEGTSPADLIDWHCRHCGWDNKTLQVQRQFWQKVATRCHSEMAQRRRTARQLAADLLQRDRSNRRRQCA